MELSNKLIKAFAKEVVNVASDTTETPTQLVGTVVLSSGSYYVQIDGSESLTPVDNGVGGDAYSDTTSYSDGDRVMVTIENHKAAITGNYTNPSNNPEYIAEIAEEVAPEGSFDILEWCISNNTSGGSPAAPSDAYIYPSSNWSMTISFPTSSSNYLWSRKVRITGSTGTVISGSVQRANTMDGLYVFMNSAQSGSATVINGGSIQAGTLIQIGYPNGFNTYIDSTGVKLRKGYTSGGTLYQDVLATFGSTNVQLGQVSSSAAIKMCNDKIYFKGELDTDNYMIGMNLGLNGYSSYDKSMYISTMSEAEWSQFLDDGVDIPYACLHFTKDYASGSTHSYPWAKLSAWNGWAGASFETYPTYDSTSSSDIGIACVNADQFFYNDSGVIATPIGPNRQITWGSKSITMDGTSMQSASVTFTNSFGAAPYIIATCNEAARVSASASNISTDGFTLNAWGAVSAVSGTRTIRWIAVGKAPT